MDEVASRTTRPAEPVRWSLAELSSTLMVRIERLTIDDAERLRTIRLRALLDAPDAFASTYKETVGRPAEAWKKQLAEMTAFVAVADGCDVGLVRCSRDHTDTDTAWLWSMWVAPEMREKGVGGALVDAAIGWALEKRIKRLILEVADINVPAIALYKRKGFQPNGKAGAFPPPREHIREHQLELRLA